MVKSSVLLVSTFLWIAGPAMSSDLVVIQGVDTFASRHYGGSGWAELTAEIDARFNTVTVLPDASDLNALLAGKRLWLDQRWVDGTLSQQEIDNLAAFVATGRRAVFIGEHNGSWHVWNNQILSILGGSSSSNSSGTAVSLGTDPVLNAGITSISLTAGVAVGGTALFDINWSTLWGNVVTVLDVGVWWTWTGDNAQYGRNVVEWLSSGVVGTALCFGDGTASPCPCANFGGPDEGCANSTGSGAKLVTSGTGSVTADDLGFGALQLPPGVPTLLFSGTTSLNGGSGTAFGDGLRCVGGAIQRLGPRISDGAGEASWGPNIVSSQGWTAGATRYFQAWHRDPLTVCGAFYNLSHSVELVLGP